MMLHKDSANTPIMEHGLAGRRRGVHPQPATFLSPFFASVALDSLSTD
jgi:hypothetical protein